MAEIHTEASYRSYWAAWLILLALTVGMLATSNRGLVMAGIAVKSTIIGAWFMHLRFEKAWLVLSVVIAIAFTCLFLFLLIAFDARVA